MEADVDSVIEPDDAAGTRIAVDDDGGEAFNASLGATLDPGEYSVLVRPYATTGGGRYVLEVTG